MTVLFTIVLVGLATFALRLSMFLIPRSSEATRADRVLQRVPAAVLPLLVASTLLPHDAVGGPPPERLVPAIVAVLIAWYTRSVALTLGGGMVTLWLCNWLFVYL
ncbi:MAG: AzlD domain-containing protein [Myxococcota bacterium]